MSCDNSDKSEKFRAVYLREPCQKQPLYVPPLAPWGRASGRCDMILSDVYTYNELQMRRKAEILKYKGVGGQSRRLQYADAVRKVRNVNRSEAIRSRCLLGDTDRVLGFRASSSNVPGRMYLYYDRSVPYLPIGQRLEYSQGDIEYL